MSNPYATPNFSDDPNPMGPQVPQGRWSHDQLRANIKIISIMLIVQGALELLLSFLLVGVGVFMMVMPNALPPDVRAEQFNDVDGASLMIMSGVYVVFGVVLMAVSILRIVAGFRNYFLRSRMLGIVSLGAGLLTVMTCYCAPTSIGLCIYGLIIYLNSEAATVFDSRPGGGKPGLGE